MQRTSTQVSLGLVLLIAGILWTFFDPAHPWGLFGSVTGLVSIAFMLINEALYAHGESYRTAEGDKGAAAANTKWARDSAVWFKVVGIPLMILSAWFQLKSPDLIHLDPLTGYPVETGNRVDYEIEGDKQVLFNIGTERKLQRIENAYSSLTYPDLLVRNCGNVPDCECPPTYQKVRQDPDGAWNLNAGIASSTKGAVASDSIVLCIAWPKVQALPQLQNPVLPPPPEKKKK